MAKTEDHLTIVFSDIVGSSRLYASLGNRRAKEKIDEGLQAMREVVTAHHGNVIKTIGDEIMCAFDDPEYACEAAIALNQTLNQLHFYLRTGMSFGTVIIDQEDFYGDTVNTAAFLAKAAQANQILFDENTYANLTGMRARAEFFDRMTLKDQVHSSIIYRLNWEHNYADSLSATIVTSKATVKEKSQAQLTLHCGGITHYVSETNSVVFGRDKTAVQILVQHKNVSRKHCTIQFQRGKFVLQDHSTNGTFVQQDAQKEVYVKKESVPLLYDGRISLGQPLNAAQMLIEYHLE